METTIIKETTDILKIISSESGLFYAVSKSGRSS